MIKFDVQNRTMRYLLITVTVLFLFASCKKDKFTTAPQIKYKSLSHNLVDQTNPSSAAPVVTLHITDTEGDLGINANDTAWVYLKNLLTGKADSLPFPDLQSAAKKNFEADVAITTDRALECRPLPGNVLHTDTLYFEFYVKDFAKNKSNVITTTDPVFFICR